METEGGDELARCRVYVERGELPSDDAPIRAALRDRSAARRGAAQVVVQTLALLSDHDGWEPRPVDLPANDDTRLAAFLGAVRAVLAGDVARARGWADWLERDAPDTTAAHAARACTNAIARREDFDATALEEVVRRARTDPSSARLVCPLTSLRALALLAEGDVTGAREAARRASRMARTEELLADEYLANLVLARVRRYAGEVVLGNRILTALARVVPGPWLGLLAWEATLAGAPWMADVADRVVARREPLARAAVALYRMSNAANAGDRVSTIAAWDSLAGSLRGHAFAPEAEAVAGALGLVPPVGEISAWSHGETNEVPGALRGLCMPVIDARGNERAAAYVLARREGTATRLLPGGATLAAGESPVAEPVSEVRTSRALAAIALAGPRGVGDGTLFEAAYDFPYDPERNHGVYRNLLVKVRDRLGDDGELVRTEGRRALSLRRDLLVADPRCVPSLEELILRVMATSVEGARSQDIADVLRVPLRTVQSALGEMVDEGACELHKDGRNVFYRIEDTTFYEPSFTRLSPRS